MMEFYEAYRLPGAHADDRGDDRDRRQAIGTDQIIRRPSDLTAPFVRLSLPEAARDAVKI
jgi:hypothetical protein